MSKQLHKDFVGEQVKLLIDSHAFTGAVLTLTDGEFPLN